MSSRRNDPFCASVILLLLLLFALRGLGFGSVSTRSVLSVLLSSKKLSDLSFNNSHLHFTRTTT